MCKQTDTRAYLESCAFYTTEHSFPDVHLYQAAEALSMQEQQSRELMQERLADISSEVNEMFRLAKDAVYLEADNCKLNELRNRLGQLGLDIKEVRK